MKRRVFTTTLLAAPALIGQARATEDKSRWIEASRFQFLDDGDLQRPNWLVLGTGETPVGWDLRPAVTEFPAETLNIGARLGGLFRKPIGERLRGGWLLGPVHMYGRNLVVPYDAEASRAAIAHQRTEWAYRSRAKRLRFNLPLVSSMFAGRGVGSAHISGDGTELIILIRPTTVRVP